MRPDSLRKSSFGILIRVEPSWVVRLSMIEIRACIVKELH